MMAAGYSPNQPQGNYPQSSSHANTDKAQMNHKLAQALLSIGMLSPGLQRLASTNSNPSQQAYPQANQLPPGFLDMAPR